MSDRAGESVKVVPFGHQAKDQRNHADAIDQSGHTIVGLLQQASDIARDNCQRAMDTAQRLSDQLRAAENRMKELEQEASYYRERAARAEKWLAHIAGDIEAKFFEARSERERQQQPRR